MKLLATTKDFSRFAWFLLAYNILVILWGAFVRATGSGAGCGSHWPLCNGEVIPRAPQIETIIEFTHRVTSGLVILLVVVLLVRAFKLYPKGSLVRAAAIAVTVFTVIESLIGAVLVLNSLTGQNDSITRAIVMMVHLVNTFLLVGALFLAALWSSGTPPVRIHYRNGMWSWLVLVGLLGMMLLGASGAVTALGDTLYPSTSLLEGFRQDFDPTAHLLIRLRVFHPAIAVMVGVFTLAVTTLIKNKFSNQPVHTAATWLARLFVLQLGLGVINVLLLAPVWMQLTHLFVTNLIWISWMWVAESFFGGRVLFERVRNDAVHQPVGETLAQ